jgi:hypothetical protein
MENIIEENKERKNLVQQGTNNAKTEVENNRDLENSKSK